LLKLAIVGIILVVGGALAYSQFGASVDKYLPVNAVAQDLDNLKDTTVDRVSYEINKTKDTVGQKIDQIKPSADEINPIKRIEDVISPPKEAIHYGQVYETDEAQKTCKICAQACKDGKWCKGTHAHNYDQGLPAQKEPVRPGDAGPKPGGRAASGICSCVNAPVAHL